MTFGSRDIRKKANFANTVQTYANDIVLRRRLLFATLFTSLRVQFGCYGSDKCDGLINLSAG